MVVHQRKLKRSSQTDGSGTKREQCLIRTKGEYSIQEKWMVNSVNCREIKKDEDYEKTIGFSNGREQFQLSSEVGSQIAKS